MTDSEMIKAMEDIVARIVKAEVDAVRAEVRESQRQTMKDVSTLMDNQFMTQFKLLAEGQEVILERLPTPKEMEMVETRLSAVETVVKKHSKEIHDLKKAQ